MEINSIFQTNLNYEIINPLESVKLFLLLVKRNFYETIQK